MDLKARIINIIKNDGTVKNPVFDLKIDEDGFITGRIISESFGAQGNWYAIVYEIIQKSLSPSELSKIKTIFLDDTLELISDDRDLLLIGNNAKSHKYWFSPAPDNSRYLVIIDMKFDTANRLLNVFYLVMNAVYEFKDSLIINYERSVIDYLEIDGKDLFEYAFDHAWGNIEALIKYDLMQRHEKTYQQGQGSWINKFSYVFESNGFKIKPLDIKKVIFTKKEIDILRKLTSNKSIQGFVFVEDINNQINISEKINNSRLSLDL